MRFTTLLSAVVRFARRLTPHQRARPSELIAPCLALGNDEVEELAEAA